MTRTTVVLYSAFPVLAVDEGIGGHWDARRRRMFRFWSWLLGPIFAKEMVETGRRHRYYINRVLVLALFFLGTWLAWLEVTRRNSRYHQSTHETLSRIASEVFRQTSLLQLAAILILVPPFVSGVIAMERKNGTLELLFATWLSDWNIVAGKLASRMFITLQLVFSSLPIIFLMSVLGGIDFTAAIQTYAALLTLAMWMGALSIYLSTRSPTPLAALLRTYWWTILLLALLPFLLFATLAVTELVVAPQESWTVYFVLMTNPALSRCT